MERHYPRPSSPDTSAARMLACPLSTHNKGLSIDDPQLALPMAFPVEVWAMVLDYLPYDSVVSCASTSKTTHLVLYGALPLITTLFIEHSSQLRPIGVLAERLCAVREICICSFKNGQLNDGDVDHDIAMMASPFLCRFPLLERVVFGTMNNGFCWGSFENLEREHRQHMAHLADGIFGAFLCGTLPRDLKVIGLCCPQRVGVARARAAFFNSGCETCRRVCRSFPVPQALGFPFCLQEYEVMNIIESRPGGLEYLRSGARLLQLLGSGYCNLIHPLPSMSDTFHIVSYTPKVEAEINRIIQQPHFDGANLNRSDVFHAIKTSFVHDGKLPPMDLCYLDEASFDNLKRIGLPIEEEDLLTPMAIKVEHLPHVVKGVLGRNNMVQKISAMQILNLLSGKKPPITVIQQLVDSDVLSTFVEFLQRDHDTKLQDNAAMVCTSIAFWENKHAVSLIEAGALPH
mmetsp:Transcript_24945/g.53805  ORF Transcript_24945/g.53805 Transcript_24945/m.53805 type:complete len:459 (-) Transcript_24945:1771-3147(-)